jgi:hypothetical protein
MKPDIPVFFLNKPGILGSLLSSEYRLGAIDDPDDVSTRDENDFSFTSVSAPESAAEKLADWRNDGG